MTEPSGVRATQGTTNRPSLPRGGFLGAVPGRPLVGRADELSRLITALDAAQQAQGRLLALVGEPGVGKTRLAQELSLRAFERGLIVLVGRCYAERTSLPFHPFREALSGGLELASDDFRRQAASRWPELDTLLTRTNLTSDVDQLGSSEDARLRLFSALAAFVRELSVEAPVALLLDDLHWADSASVGLLVHLARDLAADRVLLLVAYRDADVGRQDPLAAAIRDLTRERLLDRVVIRGLGFESTAALIGTRVGGEPIPDEFARLVHARTEGNPFFVEEIVTALAESQMLPNAAGPWPPLSENLEVPLPDSVRAVIDQRLQRVAPRVRELLRMASVLGQEFDVPLLLSVMSDPEDSVLADLDSALDARLIQARQIGRGDRYGFIHALVHQALYDDHPAHRRRLHLRAGEALERLRGTRADASAELARHFLAAGDDERALHYSVVAGDFSAGLYAHAESARHYQQAIALLRERDDQTRAADVFCRLAAELADMNRYEEALAAYRTALSTFERLHDTGGQAHAHRGMGRVYQGTYDLAAALPHVQAALDLSPPDEVSHRHALLQVQLARASYFSGDYVGARPAAERALAIAEQLGDVGLQATALGTLSYVEANDVSPYIGIALARRAEALALRVEDWRTISRLYTEQGLLWFVIGDWEQSKLNRQRAIDASERAGDIERIVFNSRVFAYSCIYRGAWEEGRAAARRAAGLDPEWRLQSQPGPAYLAWLEGRPEEALYSIRTHIAASRERRDVQGLLTGFFCLVDWALQMGRLDEAVAAGREGVEIIHAHAYWLFLAVIGGPLSEALVLMHAEEAASTLAEIEVLAEKYEQHVSDAQLLRARALLQHRQGDVRESSESLQRSAAVARGQQSLVQLGRTLAVLSEVARSAGEGALAVDADAERLRIVEQIGPEVRTLGWASPATRHEPQPVFARGLTEREVEVLRLVARGLSNIEIADELTLSVRTVERHVSNLYAKIDARNRADATAFALRLGLA